jgi:low temperature requirement protein LtrA
MGLGLYVWVASEHADLFKAVRVFGLLSILGLVAAIVGGYLDPELRVWFWLGAVVLDLLAALIGGRQEGWNLHPAHFAERHGLFVIIALGESLIAAGVGAVAQRSGDMLYVAIGAVVLSCLLWWSYFGWLKDALEHAFEGRKGPRQSQYARDTYSILHFPILAGVIGIAVAIEEMMAHPTEAVHTETLIAFGVGIVLFAGTGALAYYRGWRNVLSTRVVCLALLVAALFAAGHASPVLILVLGIVAVLVFCLVEARSHQEATAG